MKDLEQITSQAQLEQLIERYFDGMTSLQEENAMRQVLAHCPWQSDAIDDAKVVMGYFSAHSKQHRQATRRAARLRMTGLAASIAMLLAVGAYALWQHQQPAGQDLCIAYVNGQAIDNDEEVMRLIEDDLNHINAASQGMAAQLSTLGEALELDNE